MAHIKRFLPIFLMLSLLLSLAGCGHVTDSGDEAYESGTIQIEGLASLEGGIAELSVADLRKLEQHDLDASYKRTTGLTEEFKMRGPYLSDVIKLAGGDLSEYEGVGVVGRDSYYCLISKEIVDQTPDLMLALAIDGEYKLGEEDAPARLAVQGQFGPYWVRQVAKIILYKEIPQKEITSVWVFDRLAEGIAPYEYEYYGSKDRAIDLEQVFTRLDHVDSKAFFTMKSSDGFLKNEAMNMVKSRYYIKVDGADAPTNVSPYIKLGMNVQRISWFSTNADAAVFPNELLSYMDQKEIGGKKGIPLDELLYEVKIETVKTRNFDIVSADGDIFTVPGGDMSRGILTYENGVAGIVWEEPLGYKNVDSLLRIRVSQSAAPALSAVSTPAGTEGSGGLNVDTSAPAESGDGTQTGAPASSGTPSGGDQGVSTQGTAQTGPESAVPAFGAAIRRENTLLIIEGNGVPHPVYISLDDLKSLGSGYVEQVYSTVNNWPTKKFAVAKGVSVEAIFRAAGVKDSIKSIRVEASDGYYALFTKEQFLGERFCYPDFRSGSDAGKTSVKAMLSWAYEAGTSDLSKAKEEDLRLSVGQLGINDVNTAASVQSVSRIVVSTDEPGRWEKPALKRDESGVSIVCDDMDRVKIYYTLDGSEPDETSPIYNPSTSYFQPELTQPIKCPPGTTVKAVVVGFGKHDSEVASFMG